MNWCLRQRKKEDGVGKRLTQGEITLMTNPGKRIGELVIKAAKWTDDWGWKTQQGREGGKQKECKLYTRLFFSIFSILWFYLRVGVVEGRVGNTYIPLTWCFVEDPMQLVETASIKDPRLGRTVDPWEELDKGLPIWMVGPRRGLRDEAVWWHRRVVCVSKT